MESEVHRQQQTPLSRPTLEVVTGLHRGVCLVLDKDAYRIGSTTEADIVLRDVGLKSDHALLRVERMDLIVEARGGDVGFDGGMLAQGHGCRMRYPVELSFGEARIRIVGPQEDVGKNVLSKSWRSALHIISRRPLAFSVFALCSVLAVLILPRVAPTGDGSASVPAVPRAASDAERGGQSGAEPAALAGEALRQIKERLQAAGIATLKASVMDGRISVSGVLSNREAAAWMTIQQWFDETYAGRLVLTARVAMGDISGSPAPDFRVQAIWFGDHSYVVTEQGTRHEQGSFLDSGWLLSEIHENRVVLSRGGETFTISYR